MIHVNDRPPRSLSANGKARQVSTQDGIGNESAAALQTQIGNDWFAWFGSTYSKRRINFLQLLQAGERRYSLNSHALEYWCEEGLPAAARRQLQSLTTITGTPAWGAHLDALGITSMRHRRIATEGALLGGLIQMGFSISACIPTRASCCWSSNAPIWL